MNLRPAPEAAAPTHRVGNVAIVGRPNVGKSTLLNRLVGAKISITSDKPQTTRQQITGIVTRPGAQVVFVDTPGYQTGHDSVLNRAMNRSVAAGLQGGGIELLRRDMPVILAVNKTDTIKDKKRLLPFIAKLAALRGFAAVIPISAVKGWQMSDLLDAIVPLLPEGPPLHDADDITTVNERFLAAELLREKLFRLLGAELPYATTVEIEQFKEDGNLRSIQASILVEREGQKAIVIGKGGQKLKGIATEARRDMERLFGGKVFLEVWVKVRRGWANSEASLKRLGYGD